MDATKDIANEIADAIEQKIYNGITTRKILRMVFNLLSQYRPSVAYQIDLRKALSLVKPQPDFERYVQMLLSEHGYDVTPNRILRGKCGEHEVDAIARRDGVTYIVEVKHHTQYHRSTGLDVSRIARAILEDVTEGFNLGLNYLKIDKAMIVCNTKLSEHAKRYALCRDIDNIGWSTPPDLNLQSLIHNHRLYPLTYLRSLTPVDR
ncbi:unnamed protein product, partial [marine sediment metagenome]